MGLQMNCHIKQPRKENQHHKRLKKPRGMNQEDFQEFMKFYCLEDRIQKIRRLKIPIQDKRKKLINLFAKNKIGLDERDKRVIDYLLLGFVRKPVCWFSWRVLYFAFLWKYEPDINEIIRKLNLGAVILKEPNISFSASNIFPMTSRIGARRNVSRMFSWRIGGKLQKEQDGILIDFFRRSRYLVGNEQIQAHKMELIQKLNQFRRKHGLPDVPSFNAVFLYVSRNHQLREKCGSWGRG